MSTICKLDPSVRLQRTERKNSLRELAKLCNLKTDAGRLCIEAHAFLTVLRKAPHLPGAWKHQVAGDVLARLDVNLKA